MIKLTGGPQEAHVPPAAAVAAAAAAVAAHQQRREVGAPDGHHGHPCPGLQTEGGTDGGELLSPGR